MFSTITAKAKIMFDAEASSHPCQLSSKGLLLHYPVCVHLSHSLSLCWVSCPRICIRV